MPSFGEEEDRDGPGLRLDIALRSELGTDSAQVRPMEAPTTTPTRQWKT